MKKSLISIAILGALSNVAMAQSNVTMYGIVDAGITAERGGINGNVTKATSGAASASRIGFKGTEDLGSGLSAIFKLEAGVKVDDGALDNTTNRLFNREAYVGLSSKTAGTLTIGRQYTPYYEVLRDVADPFALGTAGTAKNLFPVSSTSAVANVTTGTRNDNAVVYKTPVYAGFSGAVSYSLGEQAGDSSAQRQIGASGWYTNGDLNVGIAYNTHNNDTATIKSNRNGHNSLVAVNYDFKVLKAYAAFGNNKGQNSSVVAVPNAYSALPYDNSENTTNALIGLTAPVGPAGTVMASYTHKNDKDPLNRDADQYAIGYSYALSKRTSTYVAFAKIKNKNGAAYTVGNNTEAGTGDKAFNLGVKHSF
ncbi:porin [Duganella sp. Leaf126]|uniref:porin n=1 Tax=Duganella sp. Leaf126 TaxID=1736266 RepID=UPI00070042C7|nr:porin [Duganella sp. Leaf126]KQQ47245.1 porin [Duganella sp. Leaf126]